MEEEAAGDLDNDADRAMEASEEALLSGGASDFPSTPFTILEGIFATNVISVACWPGQAQAFVGTGWPFL